MLIISLMNSPFILFAPIVRGTPCLRSGIPEKEVRKASPRTKEISPTTSAFFQKIFLPPTYFRGFVLSIRYAKRQKTIRRLLYQRTRFPSFLGRASVSEGVRSGGKHPTIHLMSFRYYIASTIFFTAPRGPSASQSLQSFFSIFSLMFLTHPSCSDARRCLKRYWYYWINKRLPTGGNHYLWTRHFLYLRKSVDSGQSSHFLNHFRGLRKMQWKKSEFQFLDLPDRHCDSSHHPFRWSTSD